MMRYGPVEGMLFEDWSLFGVPAGTGEAKSSARIERKSPRGLTSLKVTVRLALFPMTPGMSPFSVPSKCLAPTMFS